VHDCKYYGTPIGLDAQAAQPSSSSDLTVQVVGA
jgi:hypothetical protein